MKKKILKIFFISVVFFMLPNFSRAYTEMIPLELVHPSASQPARLGVAYPGIEYNVRVAAIGGKFPYVYALNNAPAGMVIDSQTGTIVWMNPQATALNIAVTVTDSLGTAVSYSNWSITVTTSGFKFVDVANGNDTTGTGSISAPWQTLGKAMNTAINTDIVYFRAGTYASVWSGDSWLNSTRAGTWLGFPGESVIFDFNDSYRLGITRQIYFDNLQFTNASHDTGVSPARGMLYISSGVSRQVIRRCEFYDLDYIYGSNPAPLRYERAGVGSYTVLQDNSFHDTGSGVKGSLSMYAQDKPLIEDNYIYDFGHTGIDLKESIQNFTVRRNRFNNTGFGKNAAAGPGEMSDNSGTGAKCNGEWLFNYIRTESPSSHTSNGGLYICPDNAFRGFNNFTLYRNTIYGTPYMSYCDNTIGPISFEENVIVNDYAGADDDPVDKIYNRQGIFTNWSKTGNLLAGTADEAINPVTGTLNGAYASYIGTKGWELSGASPDPAAPVSPHELSVQ